MSGLEPITTEIRARRLGAADYLPKPIDAYALRICIPRVLDQTRRREP
jgi:DNA-binding NtrC family response regulator